tara:strand:+ start:2545 stop:2796 length:252 start_codon:yes stop_codon:yes gene_type:complete
MTQDEIIEMAQECNLIGMRPHLDGIYFESLVAFANLVAAKEREACAKVCDELPEPNIYSDSYTGMWDITSLACGDAIRARGEA